MNTIDKTPCYLCGVPKFLHGSTCCGWKNANPFINPVTKEEKGWRDEWQKAHPMVGINDNYTYSSPTTHSFPSEVIDVAIKARFLPLLDSRAFFDVMQQYRNAPIEDQDLVTECFEKVKKFIDNSASWHLHNRQPTHP